MSFGVSARISQQQQHMHVLTAFIQLTRKWSDGALLNTYSHHTFTITGSAVTVQHQPVMRPTMRVYLECRLHRHWRRRHSRRAGRAACVLCGRAPSYSSAKVFEWGVINLWLVSPCLTLTIRACPCHPQARIFTDSA